MYGVYYTLLPKFSHINLLIRDYPYVRPLTGRRDSGLLRKVSLYQYPEYSIDLTANLEGCILLYCACQHNT